MRMRAIATLVLVLGAASGPLKAPCPATAEIQALALRRAAPATLAEALDRIDLAAQVRILRAHPHVRGIPGGSTQLVFLLAEVVEATRTRVPVQSGEKIRIVHLGEVSSGQVRASCATEEALTVGHTYLLTLGWNETEHVYVLAFGPDSVFEIVGGRLHARGSGSAAQELAGMDLAEAIRRIK